MSALAADEINVLRLTLHGRLVGYLTGFHDGVPWRAIKPHLDDTMEKTRSLWPKEIKDLPMNDEHKDRLRAHWANLQKDFRI